MRVALIALAVGGLALSGCATNTLGAISKNRDCTTKINGEVAFGSITPTGKVKFSAVCKPGEDGPPSASVPAPPAVEALATP